MNRDPVLYHIFERFKELLPLLDRRSDTATIETTAHFTRAAPGQQQQLDDGDLLRTISVETAEHRCQAAYLRRCQGPVR